MKLILDYENSDKSKYLDLYNKYKHLTLLDDWRYPFLLYLLEATKDIEGDVCECGVYKGGTAIGMANISEVWNKNLYLLDTFTGVPNSTKNENGKDYDSIHSFLDYDLERVKMLFKNNNNIKIIKGDAMNTLSKITTKLSFCHLDLNYYKSTLYSLNIIYHKMTKGGIIVIDDYGFKEYENIVKKAVDEFLKLNNIKGFPLKTGQCIIFKK